MILECERSNELQFWVPDLQSEWFKWLLAFTYRTIRCALEDGKGWHILLERTCSCCHPHIRARAFLQGSFKDRKPHSFITITVFPLNITNARYSALYNEASTEVSPQQEVWRDLDENSTEHCACSNNWFAPSWMQTTDGGERTCSCRRHNLALHQNADNRYCVSTEGVNLTKTCLGHVSSEKQLSTGPCMYILLCKCFWAHSFYQIYFCYSWISSSHYSVFSVRNHSNMRICCSRNILFLMKDKLYIWLYWLSNLTETFLLILFIYFIILQTVTGLNTAERLSCKGLKLVDIFSSLPVFLWKPYKISNVRSLNIMFC